MINSYQANTTFRITAAFRKNNYKREIQRHFLFYTHTNTPKHTLSHPLFPALCVCVYVSVTQTHR